MALTLTANMENIAMYKDIRRNLVTMYVNSLEREEVSDLFLSLYTVRPDNQDEMSSVKRKIIRFLCNPSYTLDKPSEESLEPKMALVK
jgi:hypothetical protein